MLIDAGLSCRVIKSRLHSVGYSIDSLSAIVLTHEHSDHARGAFLAVKQWGLPLYANAGTGDAILEQAKQQAADELSVSDTEPAISSYELLSYGGNDIGQLEITPFKVSHDAAEPVAFTVEDRISGTRIGIAADLGFVHQELSAAFSSLDMLMVEANHDTELLRNGPYPLALKRRIASRQGHLSNEAAGAFAASVVHRELKQVVLLHLSRTNNRPELAAKTVHAVLSSRGWKGQPEVANRSSLTGPIAVFSGSSLRSKAAVQLQLSL